MWPAFFIFRPGLVIAFSASNIGSGVHAGGEGLPKVRFWAIDRADQSPGSGLGLADGAVRTRAIGRPQPGNSPIAVTSQPQIRMEVSQADLSTLLLRSASD